MLSENLISKIFILNNSIPSYEFFSPDFLVNRKSKRFSIRSVFNSLDENKLVLKKEMKVNTPNSMISPSLSIHTCPILPLNMRSYLNIF